MKNKKIYTQEEVYEKTLKYFQNDDLATNVWIQKYAMKTKENELLESSPDDMLVRLAKEFARIELKYPNPMSYDEIYNLFKDFKFIIPGGSVMSGLGNDEYVGSLSNCFVIGAPSDSYGSIMRLRSEQVQLMKRRGGVGKDLSELRPEGAAVNNAAMTSTGPVSFMDCDSSLTKEVAQDGRRGALMLSMDVRHPDIDKFITIKIDLTKVTGANISVRITDEFMNAVNNNSDFICRFPILSDIKNIDTSKFEYNKIYEVGPKQYVKKIKAKEIWNKIISSAWASAEPGILFLDKHYDLSPDGVYDKFKGVTTNPCQPAWATVLTKDGIRTFADINVGDEIWSSEGWTKIIKKWSTGVKDVYELKTQNGVFNGTLNHRLVSNGVKTEAIECFSVDAFEVDLGFNYSKNTIPEDITSRKFISTEEVFDITVDNNSHTYWTGGLNVSNCGEIFMSPYDSCRLIHEVFTSFVDFSYEKNASIDYKKIEDISYKLMRIADDLVDLELEAIDKIIEHINATPNPDNEAEINLWNKIKKMGQDGRRCGVGFSGLGDMLAMVNIKYGSSESIDVIHNVMKTKMKGELKATIDMAIERGQFKDFNSDLERNGNNFYKLVETEFPELFEKMMTHGRRNVSWSTVAPVGSGSLLTQTTSGIEPLFMPFYKRKKKCSSANDRVDFVDKNGEKYTEFQVVHQGLKTWIEKNFNINAELLRDDEIKEYFEKSPWYGSTANDIDWIRRVEIQSEVQKYTTHSISSTINLPKEVSESKISQIYMESWKRNLKGITVYRDGSRDGILTSKNNKENNVGVVETLAPKRPKNLPCKLLRFSNNKEKWIAAVGLLDGKPYEIFTGLLEGLNIPQYLEEGFIVKNKILTGPETFEGEKISTSRYDLVYKDINGNQQTICGISNTFKEEYWNYAKLVSGLLRHGMPIKYIISIINGLRLDSSNITTWKNGVIRVLKKFLKDEETEELCQECLKNGLEVKLVRKEGCISCPQCGYSKCS